MKDVFAEKSQEITEYLGCHCRVFFEDGQTPCPGFRAMYNRFYNDVYLQPYGIHEDNEGFYVVAGTGKMMIGNEEFVLKPGVAMLAPAGVPHAIAKSSQEDLEIFLFHFPAK